MRLQRNVNIGGWRVSSLDAIRSIVNPVIWIYCTVNKWCAGYQETHRHRTRVLTSHGLQIILPHSFPDRPIHATNRSTTDTVQFYVKTALLKYKEVIKMFLIFSLSKHCLPSYFIEYTDYKDKYDGWKVANLTYSLLEMWLFLLNRRAALIGTSSEPTVSVHWR